MEEIITVSEWIMTPKGERYLYFFCSIWKIIPDKSMPVEGFRSSEHWQLFAMSDQDKILAVFPGCQIKAWFYCSPDRVPGRESIFAFE